MPELIINGPAGRLEARYHHESAGDSPIAMILHPHPQFGGTMNNQVVYHLYYTFVQRGFSVLRFNFRGVGRSQGYFDNGPGELSDAATALDWLQIAKPDSRACWIVGVSFGTWIAMQLLDAPPRDRQLHLRRPRPTFTTIRSWRHARHPACSSTATATASSRLRPSRNSPSRPRSKKASSCNTTLSRTPIISSKAKTQMNALQDSVGGYVDKTMVDILARRKDD